MPLVASGIQYPNGKRTHCLPEMLHELHGHQELQEVAA
jgi:hypothetical protein